MTPSYSDEPTIEDLRQDINQIETKLDTVINELAKITELIVDLQKDVYALSKD
jgi:hypothetical protein